MAIDIAFLRSMLGGPGEGVLQDKVMLALPTPANDVCATSALQRIIDISSSALGRIQSRASQGQLSAICDWLESIASGRAPDVQKASRLSGEGRTWGKWGVSRSNLGHEQGSSSQEGVLGMAGGPIDSSGGGRVVCMGRRAKDGAGDWMGA